MQLTEAFSGPSARTSPGSWCTPRARATTSTSWSARRPPSSRPSRAPLHRPLQPGSRPHPSATTPTGAGSSRGRVPEAVAPFDVADLSVTVNGVEACRGGGAHRDRSEVDMTPRETLIEVDLGAGQATGDIWTMAIDDYVEEQRLLLMTSPATPQPAAVRGRRRRGPAGRQEPARTARRRPRRGAREVRGAHRSDALDAAFPREDRRGQAPAATPWSMTSCVAVSRRSDRDSGAVCQQCPQALGRSDSPVLAARASDGQQSVGLVSRWYPASTGCSVSVVVEELVCSLSDRTYSLTAWSLRVRARQFRHPEPGPEGIACLRRDLHRPGSPGSKPNDMIVRLRPARPESE